MLLEKDQQFRVHRGDCITHMVEAMPPKSVDFSVYSPPFPALYAYTDSEADLGNSEDLDGEAKVHFSYFLRAHLRVMRPGRVMMVHLANIPRMKRSGGRGLFDFRGTFVRLAQRAGWVWDYEWAVRRNPQSQAIRTRSRALQFAGLESDRAASRGALPDYLMKFLAPGDNERPVSDPDQVSRDQWIDWAEFCWGDIRETNTLNGQRGKTEAKGENDTKHICPLQLDIIERLVRLYSDPGELVFSPFAGIGSELYVSLALGRRAYGCELKGEYHAQAVKNCELALRKLEMRPRTLMDLAAAGGE